MSEEEKNAIAEVKDVIEYDKEHRIVTMHDKQPLFRDTLQTLLNLIEKQQKEIEELKVINKMNRYRIDVIDERELISKDKIKAKIKELEVEQESNREDLKIDIDNLLFQNIDKIANKISINMSVRDILQSLLEKE